MTAASHLHVVTGGPGSGKTALVDALAAVGVRVVAEAGREIIRAETVAGGDALPWADRARFAERMVDRDVAAYDAAVSGDMPTMFDRGVPDTLGYLRLCGLPVPDRVMEACARCRYAPTVLVAPHWPANFGPDAERRQDAHEARATHDVMVATYAALDYRLLALPLVPVTDRVAFVRAHIAV